MMQHLSYINNRANNQLSSRHQNLKIIIATDSTDYTIREPMQLVGLQSFDYLGIIISPW